MQYDIQTVDAMLGGFIENAELRYCVKLDNKNKPIPGLERLGLQESATGGWIVFVSPSHLTYPDLHPFRRVKIKENPPKGQEGDEISAGREKDRHYKFTLDNLVEQNGVGTYVICICRTPSAVMTEEQQDAARTSSGESATKRMWRGEGLEHGIKVQILKNNLEQNGLIAPVVNVMEIDESDDSMELVAPDEMELLAPKPKRVGGVE